MIISEPRDMSGENLSGSILERESPDEEARLGAEAFS